MKKDIRSKLIYIVPGSGCGSDQDAVQIRTIFNSGSGAESFDKTFQGPDPITYEKKQINLQNGQG